MLRKHNWRIYLGAAVLVLFAFWNKGTLSTALLSVYTFFAFYFLESSRHEIKKQSDKDIEAKEVETSTREKEAYIKLKQLLNAIPSPLVYIDQRGDFDVFNLYFEQILKINANSVYDVEIDSPLRQIMLDAFLNEKQFIRQLNYDTVDYQVHSIPIFDNQRYSGCMLVFQDVTRVSEGERMQKRFIADASHELRTPITSIKGMVEILNRENFDDVETAEEFLIQIEKEVIRLEHIVEDLLLQSRLSANKVYLEKTVFNLKQFFDGVMYEKRQALHASEIKVSLNCPSNIEIFADQFRLSQVFQNLFNNSINYAPKGRITIDCHDYDSYVEIEFQDDGKGIKEDLLPHIFERFYRGEEDRSRVTGGSGLGLAISKSIVEAHGGEMTVSSEYGKGTSFIIKLTKN